MRQVLERTVRELLEQGIAEARLDGELLLADAMGKERAGVLAALEEPLDEAAAARFAHLVRLRCERVPVAYLLGRREFFSLELEVGPGVLVPRPETEGVVSSVLDLIGHSGRIPWILDAGAGSGNIAVAIAKECANARVVALDRSPTALAYAARNVRRHGVRSRVHVVVGGFQRLENTFRGGVFDVIVSNPPYVERPEGGFEGELRHEPDLALAGCVGPFPQVYELLLKAGLRLLRPGGALVVEVGVDQGTIVTNLCRAHGAVAECREDLAGIPRIVTARMQISR